MSRRRRRRRTPDLLPDTPSLPAFHRQTPTSSQPQLTESSALTENPPTQPLNDVESLSSAQTLPSQPEPPHESIPPETSNATGYPEQHQQQQRKRASTRPVVPALPNIPRRPTTSATSPPIASHGKNASVNGLPRVSEAELKSLGKYEAETIEQIDEPQQSPPRAAPKSWAELLRTKNAGNAGVQAPSTTVNGAENGRAHQPLSASLSDALRSYDVRNGSRISFLEPRGLVNTGNMCYMNSVSCPHLSITS